MEPEAGQTTVVTGQLPQVSSTVASAVALVHGAEPVQTRITGSPLHEPMAVVQSVVVVLVVLLHPTVYVRPGVHVNVRPGSQLQSRDAPVYVPPAQARVGSVVLASGGGPASTIGATQAPAAEACDGHDG